MVKKRYLCIFPNIKLFLILMSNILEFPFSKVSLNNQQFKIVTEENSKDKLLLSCAGSGKTLTIISKICYMINNLNCDPDEFLICAFNRNAGEELKKRICNLIGITDLICGTFHSIYNQYNKDLLYFHFLHTGTFCLHSTHL